MSELFQSELGVHLSRGVKLSAGWREFAANVTSAAIDYVIKGPADAVSGGLSALVKLATSLELSSNPGEKAWTLAILAFAWSIDQVKDSANINAEDLRNSLNESISTCKDEFDSESIFLPKSFLERPTTIPIYQILLRGFLSSLAYSPSSTDATELSFKIDAAFNRAVYEMWSRRPELYTPIADALNAPASASAELSLNWTAYRSRLIYEFEIRPIFGQEETRISLSQLYVPLRCTWKKDDDDDKDNDSDEIHDSPIGILDEKLKDWLNNDDASDWIRLIGGGPGSGKSTTLKSLARYAADFERWRPLFIPLQHINLQRDLRDAINSYFVETSDSAFNQPPLTRASAEDGPPLLLLFDGLDELAAPNESAKDVVGDFANRLSSLVATLDGGGKRVVRVVVTGRMPAFQAAQRYLMPRSDGAFETYGFLPAEEIYGQNQELRTLDQRPIWWEQYAKATNQSTDIPEAFRTPRLAAITSEPLLCYLLVLAGYATEQWELAADNRNRIYAALVNSIYERGWGDGAQKRQGAGKSLTKHDFNQLMETIALAAWLGGDARVASEEMFDAAVSITGTEKAWETFTADNGHDVTNLAMNFYLKSSEKKQRGFEFTHKSFGEYLASRAIIGIAREVSDFYRKKPDHAARDWMNSTKSGVFNDEILAFCIDEMRLAISDKSEIISVSIIKSLKNSFQDLAATVSIDGFPVESDRSNWRLREKEQRTAECGLWIIINSCARALAQSTEPESAYVSMKWLEDDGWSKLLRRLGHDHGTGVIFRCMSYVDLEGDALSEISATGLNLDGAKLKNSVISRSYLSNSSFVDADMVDFRFYRTTVSGANLSGANIKGIIIHQSMVTRLTILPDEMSPITFSPASYFAMGRGMDEQLDSNLALMCSSYFTRESTIDFATRRLNRLESIGVREIEDLVEDWRIYSGED
ncbi:pentapeptide repeat-containing protein [Sphingomonas sp.]|uniref:pentapeptide repeat-containing protein n=1 Tax=Sphingomonas sp. TaxID=28214 RepID=UPI0025E77D72|nr:pentapeptide repeat-containing protein [Sphingomonas sp.]